MAPALLPRLVRQRLVHPRCWVGQQPLSTAGAPAVNSAAQFAVYKGKGALQFKPIPASWGPVSERGWRGLDREGVVLVEAASARPNNPRDYDCQPPPPLPCPPATSSSQKLTAACSTGARKQTFALNTNEIGALLQAIASSAPLNQRPAEVSFVHDPQKGRQGGAGGIMKTFRLARMASVRQTTHPARPFTTLHRHPYAFNAGSVL